MKAKNKIVRLRNKYPLMSSSEISKRVGVSRVYVHNILKQNDLQTKVPKPQKVVYCKECGDVVESGRKLHEGQCTFNNKWLKVTCFWCREPFYRKKSVIRQRIKQKLSNIYCGVNNNYCFHERRRQNGNKQRVNRKVGA